MSVDTCAVQREAHPPASPPADLARLTCEQDMRSFNASRGWLGAPTHYSGQRDVGTGVIHHHRAAEALFAGFRSRGKVLRLMCPFVRLDTDVDHFCLCRSQTAGASVALCTSATPAWPMVRVRWHCQVSRPRVVSWHCGTVFCTGMPLLQGAETGGQLAACITPRHMQGNTLERNAHAV